MPFETIEAACLAIARRLATEIADRHSMMIEAHKIRPGEPLYGLKPTTRLRKAKKRSQPSRPDPSQPRPCRKMRMGQFLARRTWFCR